MNITAKMRNDIEEYIGKHTNHKEIISVEYDSGGWATVKVLAYDNSIKEVIIKVTRAVGGLKTIEYGVIQDNKKIIVHTITKKY